MVGMDAWGEGDYVLYTEYAKLETELRDTKRAAELEIAEFKEQLTWIRDHVQEFGKSSNLPVICSRASRVLVKASMAL